MHCLLVPGPLQTRELVCVLLLAHLEQVQVMAIPAEQHLDDLVHIGQGGGGGQARAVPALARLLSRPPA